LASGTSSRSSHNLRQTYCVGSYFFPKALEIKKAARYDPAPLDGVVKHALDVY